MSYRSGGYRSSFIGVGAIIGILAVGFFVVRGVSMLDKALKSRETPEGVEQQLFANAETGPIYRTLKRTYPQDYDALVRDVIRHVKAGDTNAQIDEAILTDMMQSARRQRHDVIQAPVDRFAGYRHAEIKVLETLHTADPALCATYVMTGSVRSHTLRAVQGPLIAYRIAALEAGAAGRDHPANRTVAAPAVADVQQLGRQMAANGTRESTVKAFLDGTGLAQLAPQEQCLAGMSFYKAIDRMPGDKANQIYAYLIARAG